MKLNMDIIDPPRMFLKYRKMISYAIHQKISFFHWNFGFLSCQLVKHLTLIWVGGNFTLCALRLAEIFWLAETLFKNYSWRF